MGLKPSKACIIYIKSHTVFAAKLGLMQDTGSSFNPVKSNVFLGEA